MTAHVAWKLRAPELSRDPVFVSRVMARWAEGQDTARIATELMTAECFVDSALWFGLEQRRAEA